MGKNIAIQAEEVSKLYRLGEIGTGTISRDIERWVAKVRGKEDPFLKVGETNDRTKKGSSEFVYSLKNVSFEIPQGEAVGIIGRNGAGKSTLLKVLSRVTSPTTGRVNIKGRVASLLEVGTGFHPELTGRENVYLNGAILGMRKKEIDRKFDQIVDFSGVERYIDTPVKRYSSGMSVRLAFAVAAHLDAEILVVDEVLAVGDAEFQNKCLGRMSEVSRDEGRTILFVSHNMAAVKSLCQSGIVLSNGTTYFKGEVNQAVKAYLSSTDGQLQTKLQWNPDEAPGNERIKLLSLKVKPLTGEMIDINSGFILEVECLNNIQKASLDFSFEIISEDEILLVHHGKDIDESHKLQQGRYQLQIQIPGNILNKGIYYINAWFGLEKREVLLLLNRALKFEVFDAPVDHILKPLPGILRPSIHYDTKFLGS
jgi:lipopolysaccharide transport system ATP-binding protein